MPAKCKSKTSRKRTIRREEEKLAIGILPADMLYAGTASNSGRAETWQRTENRFMSQHRSLRAAATLGGKRNVLKRFERVELLKKRGQWKEGDRITGLRKTKKEA